MTRARAAAPATRLGSSDCEHLRDGVLAQPVNALSSAAFVLAGGVVAAWASARPDLRHDLAAGLSVGLVAAGLGSIDYHGPQSRVAAWGHDWGIAIPVVVALHADAATLTPTLDPRVGWAAAAVALAGAGAVLAARPATGPAIAAVAATALAATEFAVWRTGRRRATTGGRRLLALAAGCTVVGVSAHALTRTGRPGCRPESVLQGHAFWHVSSAVAAVCWTIAALPAVQEGRA